jgi:hypothetical protein
VARVDRDAVRAQACHSGRFIEQNRLTT